MMDPKESLENQAQQDLQAGQVLLEHVVLLVKVEHQEKLGLQEGLVALGPKDNEVQWDQLVSQGSQENRELVDQVDQQV